MRRIALLGLTCLLAGCQFVGNPFDGFGGFLADTAPLRSNPNLPPGADETVRRAEGQDFSVDPLLPEPGDIWPGPMQPIPTMQDLQQRNSMEPLPPPNVPGAPPPPVFPDSQSSTPPPAPTAQDVLVPNGDGTSTLVSPDGTSRIVPTPK